MKVSLALFFGCGIRKPQSQAPHGRYGRGLVEAAGQFDQRQFRAIASSMSGHDRSFQTPQNAVMRLVVGRRPASRDLKDDAGVSPQDGAAAASLTSREAQVPHWA